MPRRRRQRRVINQMNVVPYIDVMLVLLIIFMIASPMLDRAQGIKIELPEASSDPIDDKQQQLPILIKVTLNNGFLLSDDLGIDQAILLPELAPRILAIAQKQPLRPIVIAGDKQVRYEKVAQLISFLKGKGINVYLMTQAPKVE